MKKRIFSSLLALVMVLSLLPATALAVDARCTICGKDDGTHTATCRFNCPNSCDVSYNGTAYTHSNTNCPYNDSDLYCTECGYLTYNAEEDDYFHADGCTIGYPDEKEETGEDNPPAPIAQRYIVDGVTYFGADSKYFDNSTRLFIQDMLSAKNDVLDGKSTAALWQYLAYCIQDVQGRGTNTGKFKTQFDNVIPYGLAYNTGSTGTYSANRSNGDNSYNVRSSGLVYANSMSAAADAMEDRMFSWYRNSGGGRKDKYRDNPSDGAIRKNETLWDDTEQGDVYWMVTGAYKTSGTNKKGHYQALGALFSDFSVTTILPEDSGEFYQSTEIEDTPDSTTYASSVKNMTDAQVSAQQEISNTTSSTATSEINGSKSYGFEESINLGYEVTALNSKFSVGIGFTASQTIENGWSEEKSCSDEQTTTYNVSVELPPYTNVMMKQTSGKTTTTTNYNCPVALNFTVTIVEYTLDPSSNNAACQTQVLATFGANARKDLNQRGVIEYTLTDPNGIRWSDLYNAHSELWSLVENKLTATAPMASTGAKFTAVYKTVNNEVSGLAPIYALSTVKTAKDIMEYNLSSGEYLYVDPIELEGLNAKNAAYYGFNQDKGHWTLVDENGDPLTDSSVAKLETNPVSGHTKLIAGETSGTVYLKYMINEDCYATAERPTACTRNRDLASTATIEVNVSEIPFDKGSIRVSGTLSGIVGDPAKAIEGTDGLTVTVEDGTGKEISRPVVWEAKELASKGIKVEDNQISFTKEGTFHVRAKTGTVYSEWVEVTALPARELTTIQIPETATLDYKIATMLNLADLTISYKDQYGADWASIPTLTWTCNDEGAAIDDNGVLTVPSAGVYTVTASAEDITSNTLTITVTDSSATIESMTPTTKSLTASGGDVEFTITGTNLSDGIVVKATDEITATTSGTDTEQKAVLTFPTNDSTTDAVTYTVTNSLDDTVTASVTVAKKSSGSSSSGGGGSSGGGSGVSTYAITIAETENGNMTASARTAAKDDTVTLTVTPDKGYTLETITVTDKNGNKLKLTEKDGKYTFTMPASKVTVKATFMEDNSMLNFFVDVPADAYYYDAVLWAAEKGITGGVDATHFAPNATCTRAQAVTFLWRAAGSPAPKSSVNPFTDVAEGSYYYDAVLWAVENGITKGTSDTTFTPNAKCTRAQIVTFLWRSQKSPASDSVNPFTDVAADAYYNTAVLWAAENGITGGTSATTFSPNNDCTRAQIVTFLWRALTE
ncbi:S-layer homology domain-containing protein [Flavonifractor sp. HCP28S3_F3]|uniref:S-layer homology domain-containing protein n=1 Tax=Flavonifractor sp. HCP28S3_F3 TaxID=3438939 RepID=UPI003F8AEC36